MVVKIVKKRRFFGPNWQENGENSGILAPFLWLFYGKFTVGPRETTVGMRGYSQMFHHHSARVLPKFCQNSHPGLP
jgi:hypothetical protein